MDRIAKDEDAVQAARMAAVGALRSAGLVAEREEGATGLSVIETSARPRGAAVIVTLGGPDPLEVCSALDDAGVGSEYRGDEPWRIYVLAPGDSHPSEGEPADVVDEHEHQVEDDGGDEEFEEVGTAAPMAVGVSFDRPVIRVMIEMVDFARRTGAFDDVGDRAEMGRAAMWTALKAFDKRVASVTESEA